jgi:lipopolysaccharide export system permease protein
MTKIERYIAREVIPSFLIGAILYVFVLLFQSLIGRSQWLSYLPADATARWLLWQIPDSTLKALPLSIIFAVLISFGRLARDNEILAANAGGISLANATRPVVAFGALLVAFGLVLAEFVTPVANEQVSVTWWDSVDGGGKSLGRLAGRMLETGKGQLFFTGIEGADVLNVRYEQWEGETQTLTLAKRGRFDKDRLIFEGFKVFQQDFSGKTPALLLENVPKIPNAKLTVVLDKTKDALVSQNAGGGFEDSRSLSQIYREWHEASLQPAKSREARDNAVQLGFKTALPFANLIILILVIPVAASSSRSTSMAMGLAVMIAILYYFFLALGQSMATNGLVPAFLGPWLANIAFFAAGIYAIQARQFR